MIIIIIVMTRITPVSRQSLNSLIIFTLELSSSSESDKTEEKSSKVPRSSSTKHVKDHKGKKDDEVIKIKKQLQEKEKELEEAKGKISQLTEREKDLVDR